MSQRRRLRAVPLSAPEAAGQVAAGVGDAAAAGRHQPSRPGRADLTSVMERVARGSVPAFEELYNALAGSVYGVALRIVRDPQMAEDVTQEVLVEAWTRARQFEPSLGTPRAWVLTMAQRRAVDRVRSEQSHTNRLRTHGPTQSSHGEAHDESDAVVDTMFAQWEAARVAAGLRRLSAVQREALELTYYRGFTHRELAQSLGIPLGTAKARVRDGLIKLGAALGGET